MEIFKTLGLRITISLTKSEAEWLCSHVHTRKVVRLQGTAEELIMNVKSPDCCIALRQSFEVYMVCIPKGRYSDNGTIYWFNGQKEIIETKTCPFCGKAEDDKITVESLSLL